MARIYTYMLQKTGSSFAIIHSLDGYDELSLTGDARVITNEGERVMTPEQLGKRMVSPSDLYGGNSPEEAAKIFLEILKGKGSWAQNAVVFANAAMALYCTGAYKSYDHAFGAAVASLEEGKALGVLNKLISLQ
jgi:anthranilate phosphoribosyltransferase